MERQKAIPDDSRAVTPEEQYAILSAGKSIKEYLAGWNIRIGAAATENKRIVDGIIDDKLAAMQRALKSGSTAVDIGLQTDYIMRDKRFVDIGKKDAVFGYISLYMYTSLEEFRKANRLKFIYLVKK